MTQLPKTILQKYKKWDESIWEMELQLCAGTSVYEVVDAVPIFWDYEQGKQLPSYSD